MRFPHTWSLGTHAPSPCYLPPLPTLLLGLLQGPLEGADVVKSISLLLAGDNILPSHSLTHTIHSQFGPTLRKSQGASTSVILVPAYWGGGSTYWPGQYSLQRRKEKLRKCRRFAQVPKDKGEFRPKLKPSPLGRANLVLFLPFGGNPTFAPS